MIAPPQLDKGTIIAGLAASWTRRSETGFLDAASFLLRLDHRCGDIPHYGDRRHGPYFLFIVVPPDHRRVWLGTRCNRGSLFVRLSGFGSAEPADRPDDGSPWSSRRHGAWCRPDGQRLATGAADDAAMASLPDDRRAGRRRKRLPRL